MKRRQYIFLIILVCATAWFSWMLMNWMSFVYDAYIIKESTPSSLHPWQYIQLIPTLVLFLITAVYVAIALFFVRIFFYKITTTLLYQFGSLLFILVFLLGMGGSYNGAEVFKERMCNKNIQKCIRENSILYFRDSFF